MLYQKTSRFEKFISKVYDDTHKLAVLRVLSEGRCVVLTWNRTEITNKTNTVTIIAVTCYPLPQVHKFSKNLEVTSKF